MSAKVLLAESYFLQQPVAKAWERGEELALYVEIPVLGSTFPTTSYQSTAMQVFLKENSLLLISLLWIQMSRLDEVQTEGISRENWIKCKMGSSKQATKA